MSIVEKALTKLQGAARSAADEARQNAATVRPVQSAASQPLPVNPEAGANQAPSHAPTYAPTHASPLPSHVVTTPPASIAVAATIAIENKTLQAAGMLSPDTGALMVRNQFRRLKWSLLDEIENRRAQHVPHSGSVMITSALPGEGKTFTCINLAISLAREEDYRVILVDADVAKGHITNLFGLQDRPGLMELLTDTTLRISDVLIKTNLGNLYVLPAGKFRPNVAELFAGARMAQLVAELSGDARGRVAVFDSSPVLATNAAQVLGRVLPQVLFVVRAENTTQAAALEALDLLDRTKVAAVLNQSHVFSGAENYNQNYGYYGNEER